MNKLFFDRSILFISLIGFLVAACSNEEGTLQGMDSVSLVTEIDTIVINDKVFFKDSVECWDSLYTWYLDNIVKGDSLTPESPSAESSSAMSGLESSASQDESADGDDEDNVPMDAQLLPPAGFYPGLVIPVPAAMKGGIIRCSLGGSPVTPESPEFAEPISVEMNTVVRCAEFVNDSAVRISTQTYFIGENVKMPVVAISVDPSFFSRVYVDTKRCEGSDPYDCPGLMDETEDPVHVEFFDKGSRSEGKSWEVDAGISLMGNYSRTYPKKPVGIKIKKQYQEKKLKYSLFSTRPEVNKFRGFNLRNSGNRFVGDYVGDPSMTAIVEGSSVDYQRNLQVVVFYNGVYYGIHDLRERLNEHYVETNYGIDNNTVEMVKQKKDVVTPVAGDGSAYMALLDFVANNDFSGPNNVAYEQLKTMMDVGNYADYIAAQFYLRNADWPSNNVRAWRSPEQPFKFMLFDTDQSMGWEWVSADFRMNSGGMFAWIKNDRGEGRTGPGFFANIYKQVSVNPDFRRMFINHGAIMMNDYLTYDRLAASVAAVSAQIPDEEIKRDMAKFPREYCGFYYDLGCGFDARGDYILKNAMYRTDQLRDEYRKEFGLGIDIPVGFAAIGNGSVTVDGMKLPRNNYVGAFFSGNDMLLKAEPSGGSVFVEWDDGSTDNPRLITPESGVVYKAIFR